MQESKPANGETPSLFKENYPPPRMYYSLIGCSPSAQLSSRERQNTWWENCPCMCADYVYHLEHSCQSHLIMANVRAAPHIFPSPFPQCFSSNMTRLGSRLTRPNESPAPPVKCHPQGLVSWAPGSARLTVTLGASVNHFTLSQILSFINLSECYEFSEVSEWN